MSKNPDLNDVRAYFGKALQNHGATAQGADWNSIASQELRFCQLIKVIEDKTDFTILDYGCGYGALSDYLLHQSYSFRHFVGYDILEPMVAEAKIQHPQDKKYFFTSAIEQVPNVDYAVASGVFNARLNAGYEEWTSYVLESLNKLDSLTSKGFSVNFLTKYSDAEKMQDRLYYADPCFLFDHCKRHYSRNVALLHDYGLYDFTIIVRKMK
jgi:SAM-dependent methyltransferase